MKALAREKDICVLATIRGSRPHCSLMAYVANKDCTEIYMATHSQTKKYQNLSVNPAASLLIDTRDMSPRPEVQAMTVDGVFHKIKDPDKEKEVRRKLLSAHPHLKDFMGQPEAVVIRIKIKSFLLLDGLTLAFFERVSDSVS
jgi:nitroimidazol reductase NimA-like FMN-containing flavoprotein (pyridoxamine 5'-phosphate oxidase superfamily)